MNFRGAAFGLLLMAPALLIGCNRGEGSKGGEIELPDWLSEEASPRSTAADELFSDSSRSGGAPLGLRLKVGDRFPLRKVVEQELTQDSITGVPKTNRSRLELMFAITVQEQQPDRTKLNVRYDRVKYRHDLGDEHVEFDSIQNSGDVPPAVQAYRDMVNDGFTFTLGPNNQIVDVQGLSEFLGRCLRNVPEAQRQEVVLGIEAGSGETGIANFVDNSIGLLPYGSPPRPGDTWERQQQIPRPVPMYVNNVYTLKDLTDNLAVIDIRGSIAPSTVVNTVQSGNGVQVKVDGGSTLGSCTIFRDTGLPKESRVDRQIDMTVTMSNTIQFRQRKRITTTIESYPAAGSAPPLAIGLSDSEPVPKRENTAPFAPNETARTLR